MTAAGAYWSIAIWTGQGGVTVPENLYWYEDQCRLVESYINNKTRLHATCFPSSGGEPKDYEARP